MSRASQILACLAVVALAWTAPATAQGITVGFGGAASDAPESLATPVIVVKLSAATTETVTVNYSGTGGTATRGATPVPPADYVLPDGTLTFAPGSIVQTVPIQVVDDSEAEQPETVLLALSDPQHAGLGAQSAHTFTIRDDDTVTQPVVGFAATASSGNESIGTAKLAVVVYPASEDEVSVDYAVGGGTATEGSDYALQPGTVTFAAGETSKVISLAITDDTDVEETETVAVKLSNAQEAVLGYNDTHTFAILDNDKEPVVEVGFQAPQSAVPESVGTSSVSVVVAGGPRTENVTVSYGVTGGSAQGGGVDFTLEPGTLTFTPEQSVQSIPLQIVDDDVVELDETAAIALSGPAGAKLGKYANHELTIRDNDQPTMTFALAASEAAEGSGRAPITVQLSQASPKPVLADYTLGGTATQGDDYALSIGTVTFKPGDTSATIVPEVLDDDLVEGDETVVLTLTTPIDAKLGTPDAHVLTIKDNDDQKKPTVSFETDASMGEEFTASLQIAVQLSNPLDKDVTIPFEVSGTATKSDDFTLTAETVSFPAGSTRAFITGTVVDDKLDEADETIVVRLQSTDDVKLAEPYLHTRTLLDNDYDTAELTLFQQQVLTINGKTLTVLGPKAVSVNPRGLAVDKAGNYYISDWGPTPGGAEGEGGILFWQFGLSRIVKIISGLTRPGDVELSTDQQALLVAGEGGKVARYPLGLSVKFTNIDPFSGGIVVHAFGAGPEKVVKASPDGYFHVTGLLEGDSSKITVDLTVERHGTTKTFTGLLLGQLDGLYGHRIAKLEY